MGSSKKKKSKEVNASSTINSMGIRKNDVLDVLDIFSFRSGHKTDFSVKTIFYLERTIDRLEYRDQINKYVDDYYLSKQIEMGIFEFVLTREKHLDIIPQIMPNMYISMVDEICENLDPKNKRINNKTLLPKVKNNEIHPFTLAFLSPHQIHPERWKKELNRQIEQMKLSNDMPTTDLYKCYKCGARKSIVAQMQIRSADEPMTLFITCTECHNTYTKNG